MEPGCPLEVGLREFLPKRESLEGPDDDIFKTTGYFPAFVSSVRHVNSGTVKDGLVIKALNCITKDIFCFIVSDLNYVSAIPERRLEGNLAVKNAAASFKSKCSFVARVFNSEVRVYEEMRHFCMSQKSEWDRFNRGVNDVLHAQCDDNVYTFGDHRNTYDGNTIIFQSGVHCGHVYYMKEQSAYVPRDLVWDAARDGAWLVKCADEIAPWAFREGSFDVETIFNPKYRNKSLVCEPFEQSLLSMTTELKRRHQALKETVKGVRPPPTDVISQRLHQMTSVSLVISNKHVKKVPGVRRKELYVFYDGSINAAPLEKIETDELGFSFSDIVFVPCASEYDMIKRFLTMVEARLDVLYVYNAQFDITVLQQRLYFYAWPGRKRGCCEAHSSIPIEDGQKLVELWEAFLSELPEIYKGKIYMGLNTAQNTYRGYLNQIERLKSNGLTGAKLINAVSSQNIKYGQSTNNIQNLKVDCFGKAVIDMMLMVTQQCYEAVNGSLNTKSKLIIKKFRPKKQQNKMEKLKDVSYEKLDEYYHTGGSRLAECLVYNLIDSLLVNRLVRYMNPIIEYIFRQISTLNNDVLCHTRGTGNFSGFIQSVKSVEISRLKARIDSGIMVAVGHKHHNLYLSEVINRRGGFVMTPLTGLAFAGPKMSLELCLDFASLYPSNMCDLNISPESIIDHGNEHRVNDFVVFDWNKVPDGFKKYTSVFIVDRETDPVVPRVKRHLSDTASSLKRLLALRKYHKGLMKNDDPMIRAYHNRLQNEMKICANTHYGVAEHTCSVMITTIGQHKIKHVNTELRKINSGGHKLFPNYGDTDSTMFYSPPDLEEKSLEFDSEENRAIFEHSDELRDHVAKNITKVMTEAINKKFSTTAEFVATFLNAIEGALFDNMLANMILFHDGKQYPSYKRDGTWFVDDPETGLPMELSGPYRLGMITALEYENSSSIVCHVAKKMYLCLTHETSHGKLAGTSFKKRGVVGFKSSRFGATEIITHDFVDLIYKGHVIVQNDHIDAFETKSLKEITPGAKILDFDRPVELNELGFCVNSPRLIPYRVKSVIKIPTSECTNGLLVCVALVACEPDPVPSIEDAATTRCLYEFFIGDYNVSHLFSIDNILRRQHSYVRIARFRAYSIAAGMVNWKNLVQHNKVEKFKQDFIVNRARYSLDVGKETKLPYVNLLDKKTKLYEILGETGKSMCFPGEWVKQDPAFALSRRYPVNLCVGTMIRDYFGGPFICEQSTFVGPRHPLEKKDTHSLMIKSHIDSNYLNPSSKFLAHTVICMELFYGCRYEGSRDDIEETVKKIVGKVREARAELERLIEEGGRIFYRLFRNVPPELKRGESTGGAYSAALDRALRPMPNPVRLRSEFYPDPARILEIEMRHLKTEIENLIETHIELCDSSAAGPKTLCAIPRDVTEELGLPPIINLTSNETAGPGLLKMCRTLYITLLLQHITKGPAFKQHPEKLTPGVLGPPPAVVGGAALREWLSLIADHVAASQSLLPHCVLCQVFWADAFADPGGFIKKYYKFTNGVFVLKNVICDS